MRKGLTAEAIERVSKKYGGTLLKDNNPELFQAELSAGPSTVFLSRPSTTSEQSDLETIDPESSDLDEDDYEDDEDDGPEHCPICRAESDWGGMNTCEHYIGVVIDGHMLDCRPLETIMEAWISLCTHDVAINPMVLGPLADQLGLPDSIISTFIREFDEVSHDPSPMDFLSQTEDTLGIVEGRYVTTEGMLSGSVLTLYATDPDQLRSWTEALLLLASEVEAAATE